MEVLIKFILVFLQGAVPWIEILIAIPVGAAIGLPLTLATIAAFTGNLIAVYLVIAGFRWWEQRRGPVRRRWSRRAMRTWERYGLPGVALLAPLIIGTHVAALMALALGTPRWVTGVWLFIGLVVWTAITVAGTALGLAWFSR